MPTSSSQPAPEPVPSTANSPELTALLAKLSRMSLHGRVVVGGIAGEEDVRVQVTAENSAHVVELLWCLPEERVPGRLDAVRVAAGQRQIWRSRDPQSTPHTAAQFARDLLVCQEDALARLYLRLG